MHFTKMQGAGNDYVVLQTINGHQNWSNLVKVMCNRQYGIGADSLLIILPSNKAEFKMRIFDPDGSEAEACGNGIRCLARYVNDKRLIDPEAAEIMVETASGVRKIKLHKQDGRLVSIEANLGEPRFDPKEVPFNPKGVEDKIVYIMSMVSYRVNVLGMDLVLNAMSMGNPHAVHFQDKPVAEFPLDKIGPIVEHLLVFPNRVNFEVARVMSKTEIEARVWERGVGETLACGSGACAICVAAQKLGYAGNEIDIKLRGGVLRTEWRGSDGVLLSGPAEIVFEGEWPDEVRTR